MGTPLLLPRRLPPLLRPPQPLSRRVPVARPVAVAGSTRDLAVMPGNNSSIQQMHPVQKILKAATRTAKNAMKGLARLAKTRKARKGGRKGGYKYF